jgi:hypothetical protein
MALSALTADLPHDPHEVGLTPALNALSLSEPEDGHTLNVDALTAGGHA